MNPVDDQPSGIDEKTERMICRLLDGEATAEERAATEQILSSNAAARAIFDECRRIDGRAAEALRHDVALRMAPIPRRHRSSLRVATAGGLLAAAAVIALSLLPPMLSRNRVELRRPNDIASMRPGVEDGVVGASGPLSSQSPRYVNYPGVEQPPVRRLRQVRREWIGIPGSDPNTILIIERNAQKTTLTPIAGDF